MRLLLSLMIFLILSFGSVLGGIFGNKRYEEILPITHFSIIIIMFIAGIFDVLEWGVWIILAIVIIGYIICGVYIIKNKIFYNVKNRVLTDCFWIFLFSYFMINICNYGKVAHNWDEFTCWATRVKDMCRLDVLYTSELAHTGAKTYPPAIALLQYFYEKMQFYLIQKEVFMPEYLFVAYQIFMVSLLLPILGQIKERSKNVQFYMFGLFLIMLPAIFYSNAYDTILVDQLMGVMLGYCFVLLLNRKGDIFGHITFVLCQLNLILLKDIAIYFCSMMFVYWIIDTIIKNYKNGNLLNKNIVWDFMGIASFFYTRFLWNQNVLRNGLLSGQSTSLSSEYGAAVDINIFLGVILGKVNDYRQVAFLNYLTAFFEADRGEKYYDMNSYDIGSFNISSLNISVSYFGILIVSIILLFYINQCYKCNYENKRHKYLIMGELLLILGYLGIMLLTYMFLFNEEEARTLNCYDRYISMVFLMLVYIIISDWVKLKWHEKSKFLCYIVLILFLLIPGEALVRFVDRQNVYSSQATENAYIGNVHKIEEVIGDNSAKIAYLNLNDNSMLPFWKIRYGFNTNQIDYMNNQRDDLISMDGQSDLLYKYDYILIMGNTNEFRESMNAEIENAGNESFDIYKVQDLKLIRIL